MLQPRQHNLFTCLLDLTGKEYLIQNRIDFVKVEYQVQLADVAKELIEDLHKEMDGLEVCELVIVGIDTYTKKQARVSSVDYLGRGQVLTHERLNM
jgi:hypothetical protein